MVAEEFEALITVGAIACGLERRNVGEGRREQRRIGKRVADPLFDRSRSRLCGSLPRGFLTATGPDSVSDAERVSSVLGGTAMFEVSSIIAQ